MSNDDTMSVNAIRVLSADAIQKPIPASRTPHLAQHQWLTSCGQDT